MITLWPRPEGTDLLTRTHINVSNIQRLATAAEDCWNAILEKDIMKFGKAFRNSFEAQVAIFPDMVNEKIIRIIEEYQKNTIGWKLSGAGAGGYLVLVSEEPVEHAMKLKIRRPVF